jgi:parallel beta-helix repeat protein
MFISIIRLHIQHVNHFYYFLPRFIKKHKEVKKTKAKNRIILLSVLIIGVSMFAASVEPASAATVNVTSSMTNSQIQTVLDNAADGDTINFLGNLYKNIQLTISKTLNIVTSVGTVLSGSSSSNSAVFSIKGSQSSGTKISGFTINATGTGILINNTSNVTISNDTISSLKGTAVIVNKSSSVTIKNDTVSNSITGINVTSSKNTKITSSTIKNSKGDGITVESSVNTTINKDKILNSSKRGIKIYKSTNTVINGSTLEYNGNYSNVGIYSDESAVYVQNSSNTKITGSKINNNSQGVTTKDSSNVTIKSNTINDNYADGAIIGGYAKNVLITGNYIQRNANGVNLNYNSGGNVIVLTNVISDSIERSTIPYQIEDTGNGINYGHDYKLSKDEHVKHNVIANNAHREIDGHDTDDIPPTEPNIYGYEWSGNNPLNADANLPFCCKVRGESALLKISRIGDGSYAAYFVDPDTGEIIRGYPPISVTFTVGGHTYTVMTSNGVAVFKSDSVNNLLGFILANFGNQNAVAAVFSSIEDDYTILGIPKDPNTPNKPTTPSNNTGGTPEGNGNGLGPAGTGGDGASSGTSASTGLAAAAAASGGSTGNNGQDGSNNGKTAQELFIDDTVKNPTVWSIIGIIVLIVVIFGAYYRKDLMSMIRKSRK